MQLDSIGFESLPRITLFLYQLGHVAQGEVVDAFDFAKLLPCERHRHRRALEPARAVR